MALRKRRVFDAILTPPFLGEFRTESIQQETTWQLLGQDEHFPTYRECDPIGRHVSCRLPSSKYLDETTGRRRNESHDGMDCWWRMDNWRNEQCIWK
jgi:hypothetical protein